MAFAFFKLPCAAEGAQTEALNAFFRSHSVLSVHKEWVSNGDSSFWAFCLQYQEQPLSNNGEGHTGKPGSGSKVDYKQVLTEEQFQVFARLRHVRKTLAEREAMPLFAVFTNEQLAEMAKLPVRTLADLKSIAGVGEARAAKYGTEILKSLAGHETGEASV